MKSSYLLSVGFKVFALSLVIGCAGKVKKADISATADPAQEIQRIDGEIQAGYQDHLDVLAPKDFAKSQKALSEAKEEMRDGESQEDILEEVAIAQGHLDAAKQTAESRSPSVEGVINARTMALKAGAHSDPASKSTLKEIDDDLRGDIDDLSDPSADGISSLQSRYMDLELAALKGTNLGAAKAKIEGVRSRAEKYAPETLRRATLDVKTAENAIAAERRSPENYEEAVAKANATAELLVAAINENRQADWELDEATSLRLVNQKTKIAGLERDLDQADATSEVMGETIEQQTARLQSAGSTIAIQKALESARQEFSADEAEVYQQGDKLLIRLKAIKFPSGSADLPASAFPILAKVKNVAQELDPEEVVVEGHTDSTGSAAINTTLSKDRAEAVATYFGSNGIEKEIVQAVGLGFQKPIASNKTASGRSINRRVDVIITPTSEQTATDTEAVE